VNFPTSPKIALALITRHLDDPDLILRFVDNARRFRHPVDRVIAAYSHRLKASTITAVSQRIRIDILHAANDGGLRKRLRDGGLNERAVDDLLDVPSWVPHRQAPYSAYRNAVLLHALVEGMDGVIFFDSDVYPKVLTGVKDGRPSFRRVDFVGTHVSTLSKTRIVASTSDYSGYYIIPPMAFDGLEQLLTGLRKQKALDYVKSSGDHHCLNLGSPGPRHPRPTKKLLGGNLGLGLRHPEDLSLFYSTTYVFHGKCIMGRGEDTLLGRAIARSSRGIVDVDLPVFHDTYSGFPDVPDMCQEEIRTRFYQACLGWIGRNPFLTWFLDQAGELGVSFDDAIQRQRAGLQAGGPKAAQAFDDPRFADLSRAFEASLGELPVAIRRYERLMAGWNAFLDVFYPGRGHAARRGLPKDAPLVTPEDGWTETVGTGEDPVASSPTVV
jgi:hypothetical protein